MKRHADDDDYGFNDVPRKKGLTEEDRERILKMVEAEPEVCEQKKEGLSIRRKQKSQLIKFGYSKEFRHCYHNNIVFRLRQYIANKNHTWCEAPIFVELNN